MKSQTNFKTSSLYSLLKPSLKAGVYYFAVTLLVTGCSTVRVPGPKKDKAIDRSGYQEMEESDFSDHLASLKIPFLSTPGIRSLRNENAIRYLQRLAGEIIAKNETFFKTLKEASVEILDLEAPLHFSLPEGQLFISKGLIAKYLKHESMLVSVLAYELVRSEHLLYPKQTIIPVGYLPLERLLSLSRLSLDEKMEIHKWAYYLTTRSGYDGEYYLSWLQIQNRNTADFILQVGDANLTNREESLFKAFLIKTADEDQKPGKTNSSKTFYTFLNSIRDQS